MQKKILVIDDDSNIRDYLSSLFDDNGYKAFVAADSESGLQQAKKIQPDLITLDIEMPGDWGPRFYQQLTQDSKLKDIPIIIISGIAGSEHAVAKAAASISKPFDPDKLLRVVRDTLNGLDG
jgi:CheY-like chemotaxis protein